MRVLLLIVWHGLPPPRLAWPTRRNILDGRLGNNLPAVANGATLTLLHETNDVDVVPHSGNRIPYQTFVKIMRMPVTSWPRQEAIH